MISNGTNRINKIMKMFGFRINLIRDTTIPMQDFKVFDREENSDLTEVYGG